MLSGALVTSGSHGKWGGKPNCNLIPACDPYSVPSSPLLSLTTAEVAFLMYYMQMGDKLYFVCIYTHIDLSHIISNFMNIYKWELNIDVRFIKM